MNRFRPLRADEIDCRIAQIKSRENKETKKQEATGLTLLLYKDARCDQNILDETVGEMNWERKHSRENANCTVSIWDSEKGMWISKEDTGTESNTEKEKGLASDSFKRACFNWGIGRELYSAPFIWIKASDCEIQEWCGKFKCFDNFTVKEIEYKNGCIVKLKIRHNKTKKIVFDWADTEERPEEPDKQPQEEPKQTRPSNNVNFKTGNKVPSNVVQEYIKKELVFMGQMFGIADKNEMLEKFKNMRKALINGGVIEDIPSEQQTLEQAEKMFEAIYANFRPSGEPV